MANKAGMVVLIVGLAFAVPLRAHHGAASFDVGKCLGSVDGRLAHAEKIEIGTIEDGDPHDFFNPSSQALNC